MRNPTFHPILNGTLEDRIALSHAGAIAMVHVDHAHPTPHNPGELALKTGTLNDVNRKIDAAFTQFNKGYKKDIVQVDRTGNEVRFQTDLGTSVDRLRATLAKQAARIPGGTQTLTPVLNARVDSLVHDLATVTTRSSTDLVHSDQAGAHGDVQNYVHDAVAKGDFSLR